MAARAAAMGGEPAAVSAGMTGWKNRLYYGDNIDWLNDRDQFPSDHVDLVYLDPPFNADRIFNIFLVDEHGEEASSQIHAFNDTWTWTHESDVVYRDIQINAPDDTARALEGLFAILGKVDLMAYLVMMTPRLLALRRVLKPSGSLYLHCDPTASHYLKVILDSIFGAANFRNEIIWRRTGAHSPRKKFGPIHDVILFYTKSKDYQFNTIRRPYTREHVESRYTQQPDGRWKFTSGGNVLTGAGAGGGDSSKPWRGFDPAVKDRHWAVPGFVSDQMPEGFEDLPVLDRLEAAYQAGLIEIIEGQAWPQPVRYLEPQHGNPVGDIWAYQPGTKGVLAGTQEEIGADVAYLGPTSPERLGYPTQKPVGLMERIISASCPEDGVVLDPFCGCGTTVEAAQRLKRRWLGIDISYLSIDLIEKRLLDTFGSGIVSTYETLGDPTDLAGARALATEDKFDFERWAVAQVNGQPNEKQVGDKGKDGVIRVPTNDPKKSDRVLVSVKGGVRLVRSMVDELKGALTTHDAKAGVLITLEQPTRGMRDNADTSGVYRNTFTNKDYPRIQILTVEEVLEGKRPDLPPALNPYKQAARAFVDPDQLGLDLQI